MTYSGLEKKLVSNWRMDFILERSRDWVQQQNHFNTKIDIMVGEVENHKTQGIDVTMSAIGCCHGSRLSFWWTNGIFFLGNKWIIVTFISIFVLETFLKINIYRIEIYKSIKPYILLPVEILCISMKNKSDNK